MENKKTNIGLIISIVIFGMLILFGVCLFALSKAGYLNFNKNTINENTNNNNNNNNDIEQETDENLLEQTINYSTLIGTYVDSDTKTANEITNTGGVVLNIYSISENEITLDIQSVSTNQRIALSEKENIELIKVENNQYNFNWTNDSWNNTGNGTIIIDNDEILLSINTTKIADENNTGWSLGNFKNKKMYKVN